MKLIATRLGIIACRYLVSGYYENRYISAPEISLRYNMNIRALMPALRQLTRAGILRSRVGGTSPGFIFSKDPEEYTMLHIVMALEGSSKFECCKELIPGLKCDCEEKSQCGIFALFEEIIGNVEVKLNRISIAEHAQSHNKHRF